MSSSSIPAPPKYTIVPAEDFKFATFKQVAAHEALFARTETYRGSAYILGELENRTDHCSAVYIGFETNDLDEFVPLAYLLYERITMLNSLNIVIRMCFTLPAMALHVDKATGSSSIEIGEFVLGTREVDGQDTFYFAQGQDRAIITKLLERFIRWSGLPERDRVQSFILEFGDATKFSWLRGAGIANGFAEFPHGLFTGSLFIKSDDISFKSVSQ
jgi:hypothetical protein